MAVAPSAAPHASIGNGKETSNTGGSNSHSPSPPLDMLVAILKNPNGSFQPELGANTCTLLSSLVKGSPEDVQKVKDTVKPALEALAAGPVSVDTTPTAQSSLLQAAAKKTLEIWGTAAA